MTSRFGSHGDEDDDAPDTSEATAAASVTPGRIASRSPGSARGRHSEDAAAQAYWKLTASWIADRTQVAFWGRRRAFRRGRGQWSKWTGPSPGQEARSKLDSAIRHMESAGDDDPEFSPIDRLLSGWAERGGILFSQDLDTVAAPQPIWRWHFPGAGRYLRGAG